MVFSCIRWNTLSRFGGSFFNVNIFAFMTVLNFHMQRKYRKASIGYPYRIRNLKNCFISVA